ncbi:hypothetical protein CVT26_004433 [Gymnopilus dilepis]|uniref:LysM domain-containing protein n=1 Tax=Gymnopilus dilepis TaxID=231916 RepID=A0A409WDW7_9AGAR|nr:hypothetical protein CVT26_004433 [Gymnopilus dilepis]
MFKPSFNTIAMIVFCALAATSASAQIAFPTNCARNYTVQDGDFCDKISANEKASTYQLATANAGIIDPACDNLFVGETRYSPYLKLEQVICLGLTGHDCDTVHVVANGDGCPDIATAAGISLADLLANNPNINADCSNIYIGEVLCVAPVASSSR